MRGHRNISCLAVAFSLEEPPRKYLNPHNRKVTHRPEPAPEADTSTPQKNRKMLCSKLRQLGKVDMSWEEKVVFMAFKTFLNM